MENWLNFLNNSIMENRENEERYKRSRCLYIIMAIVLVVYGFIMLMLALTPTLNVEDVYNPPYFVGAYLNGSVAFVCAYFCLFQDGKDKPVKEESLIHEVRGHYSITITMAVGCIPATIVAFVGTFVLPEDASGFDKALAIITDIGCILGVLMIIVYIYIMARYGKYLSRYPSKYRQNVANNTNDTIESIVTSDANDRREEVTEVPTNAISLELDETHSMGTNSQMEELKSQNQLLQKELERQKEINQQLQQEQQQHGVGSSSLPVVPPYSPEEPPPSYESVKR